MAPPSLWFSNTLNASCYSVQDNREPYVLSDCSETNRDHIMVFTIAIQNPPSLGITDASIDLAKLCYKMMVHVDVSALSPANVECFVLMSDEITDSTVLLCRLDVHPV